MPSDLITSTGPHKQFPFLRSLGCPGGCTGAGCGSGKCAGNCSRGPGQNNLAAGRLAVVQGGKTPLNSRRVRIAGGDRGTAQTIAMMQSFVMGSEGIYHPEIRRQALAIVKSVPSRDQQGELKAVLQWVKSNIAFRGELFETLQTPLVTLQLQAGDCDCQNILMSALLMNLGYKVRFNTVAADPTAPRAFSHVYLEVFKRSTGEWVALDSTVPQSSPGWAPPQVFRRQAWRPMGNLGDDPTPKPATTKDQIFALIAPITQGVADRIRYGGKNPPQGLNLDLNTTSSTIGGISPNVVYAGGALALVAIIALSMRGGRRKD